MRGMNRRLWPAKCPNLFERTPPMHGTHVLCTCCFFFALVPLWAGFASPLVLFCRRSQVPSLFWTAGIGCQVLGCIGKWDGTRCAVLPRGCLSSYAYARFTPLFACLLVCLFVCCPIHLHPWVGGGGALVCFPPCPCSHPGHGMGCIPRQVEKELPFLLFLDCTSDRTCPWRLHRRTKRHVARRLLPPPRIRRQACLLRHGWRCCVLPRRNRIHVSRVWWDSSWRPSWACCPHLQGGCKC